jgi:hypothetical protein
MSLTVEQADACKLISDHLKQQPQLGHDEELQEADLEPADDYEDDEDADEDSSLGHDILEQEVSSELSGASVAQNTVEQLILNLLIALYTHLPSKDDSSLYSPLLRFIILSSYRRTGEWLQPGRITRLFSVILFCGRQVMYAIMQRCVVESSGVRYST